ncbi:MAG: fimbrillin family protein [Bacteroidales bacterium]|nr:fimbrillin family protein [Bacteroidales bacterium]
MKYIRTHILMFAMLAIAAVSCSKGSTVDTPITQPDPDKPAVEASLPNISFGKVSTKGLMNDADLKHNGNKIKVYDLLSSFTGTITGWDGVSPYIADEVIYDGSDIWKYVSNGVYPWTSTGVHKFFGYLSYDAIEGKNITDLFTPTLTTSGANPTLTVPSISFTSSSTQFDFIYSDVVQRYATDKNYQVVPLFFKHLFTALSVQVENTSEVPVRVNNIYFENLKNTNSATVTFDSPTSRVTYGTVTNSGSFFPAMTSQELNKDQSYDALTKQRMPSEKTFFLLWPLSAADISPTNGETDPDRIAAGSQYLATDSLIVVNYQLYVGGEWKPARTARMKIPDIAWEAGKKNHFNIQFTDKIIQLTCEVLPWDYNEYDVDYSEGSVVCPQGLKFDASTCSINDATKVVTVTSGQSPKATFTIVAPVGGTWRVGITGDTQYFTVEPNTGSINPTVSGGLVTLTIVPNLSLSRPTDKSIHLSFSVTKGTREISANDEINRDDWEIVLPAN